MQKVTREIAFSPESWSDERREKISALFDGLAPEWHTRSAPERLRATRDALTRGGIPPGGVALEIGSGTGLQTPVLREHFSHVVSIDIAAGMLALSPQSPGVSLVRADASRLPIAAGRADAIVCVNAFLFPAEYSRALRPGGTVVFVSSSGEQTPIFLSPEDVLAAFEAAGDEVAAVSSRDGWAVWTVVRPGGESLSR